MTEPRVTDYPPLKMHLASIEPGLSLSPGLPAAPAGKKCIKSKLATYTSAPGDTAGGQEILEQIRPGQERIAYLLPHGPSGGGNPNTSFGWVGHAKADVTGGAAGTAAYMQGTGQGPVPYYGPEPLFYAADAAATQLSITVFDYVFE
jgi:hypothetical protein